MFTARNTGTFSSAPEAALASAPVSSGALRSCMITAGNAERRRGAQDGADLRGSLTWSSTSTGPCLLHGAGERRRVSGSASSAAPW